MAKGFFDIKAWQKADDLAVDVIAGLCVLISPR